MRIRDLDKQGSGPSTPRGFARDQRKAAGVEDSESETEAPQVTQHAALPAGGMSMTGRSVLARCSASWGKAVANYALCLGTLSTKKLGQCSSWLGFLGYVTLQQEKRTPALFVRRSCWVQLLPGPVRQAHGVAEGRFVLPDSPSVAGTALCPLWQPGRPMLTKRCSCNACTVHLVKQKRCQAKECEVKPGWLRVGCTFWREPCTERCRTAK